MNVLLSIKLQIASIACINILLIRMNLSQVTIEYIACALHGMLVTSSMKLPLIVFFRGVCNFFTASKNSVKTVRFLALSLEGQDFL